MENEFPPISHEWH